MENEKIIDKIRKLFALAESEEALENFGAAINIATKAKEMLQKYKLEQGDLQTPEEQIIFEIEQRVGKTLVPNPFIRSNARNKRSWWFESLAKIVAENNSCKIGIANSGEIEFYGFALDRDVAIMIFNQLAKVANAICKLEMEKEKKQVGTSGLNIFAAKKEVKAHLEEWVSDEVFIDSFHKGFQDSILKTYETSQAAIIPDKVLDYWNNSGGAGGYDYYPPIMCQLNSYCYQIGLNVGTRISEKKRIVESANSNKTSLVLKKKRKQANQLHAGNGGVFLAVDCSGSMYGDKISQARNGALDFAKSANKQGLAVGLIKFETKAVCLLEPTMEINGNVEQAILGIQVEGSTNMKEAIDICIEKFLYRKNKRVLVIVTDGMPDNRAETLKSAQMAKTLGIEIRTIGTYDANESFLREIASSPSLVLTVGDLDLGKGMEKIGQNLLGTGDSIKL